MITQQNLEEFDRIEDKLGGGLELLVATSLNLSSVGLSVPAKSIDLASGWINDALISILELRASMVDKTVKDAEASSRNVLEAVLSGIKVVRMPQPSPDGGD